MTKKNGWLDRLLNGNKPEETVRLYDPDTGEITEVPRSQLNPGWVHADVEGIDGYVWIDANKLQMSEIVHEELDEALIKDIVEIREILLEHRNISMEEWEDGFKRDQNPDKEVALWLNAARTYRDMVGHLETAEERDELYTLIVVCLNSPKDSLENVFRPKVLARAFVDAVADRYYG